MLRPHAHVRELAYWLPGNPRHRTLLVKCVQSLGQVIGLNLEHTKGRPLALHVTPRAPKSAPSASTLRKAVRASAPQPTALASTRPGFEPTVSAAFRSLIISCCRIGCIPQSHQLPDAVVLVLEYDALHEIDHALSSRPRDTQLFEERSLGPRLGPGRASVGAVPVQHARPAQALSQHVLLLELLCAEGGGGNRRGQTHLGVNGVVHGLVNGVAQRLAVLGVAQLHLEPRAHRQPLQHFPLVLHESVLCLVAGCGSEQLLLHIA
mmetsp:Transcript_14408/g.27690  ORF Transcript_14408/g.27690 Transcript_14408/m.27690 type:complete len:264 (-) Transcript_14408:134-925(-)